MSVVKFNRNFSALFNWDSDESPTTEQEYQNAVKNWTETEMNIVDTILWQPETDYVENNIVKTPSLPLHYVLVCATGGTSGTEEPSYDNVQIGDNVTDGTVTWTVAKLTVSSDVPPVTDRAMVDASNIGVNAEEDNSELWGSAIGGGAVAEDDGKLVTGGTVYAVTSELASDIADNADDIATNTANISQNATDIDIADKRISNIEKLLQGNLYDYQTDSTSAYTKTVPNGAMPYAGLEQIGGKTVVWNQLVQNGNFADSSGWSTIYANPQEVSMSVADGMVTATVISALTNQFRGIQQTGNASLNGIPTGHKVLLTATIKQTENGGSPYIGLTSSTAGTSSATALGNGWYRASQFCTITAGSEHRIQVYVANYNTYTSVQIGETMQVKDVNAFDLTLMYGAGNEPTTVEEFTAQFPAQYYAFTQGELLSAGVTEVVSNGDNLVGTLYQGYLLSNGAFYNSSKRVVTDYISVSLPPLECSIESGKLIEYITEFSANRVVVRWSPKYDSQNVTHVLSENTAFVRITYRKQDENADLFISEIADVSVINKLAYPIPVEIQAIEGYGWSAGSVYNYIDYERRVFVKRVGAIDVGSINWGGYDSTLGTFWSLYKNWTTPMRTVSAQPANIVCNKYVTINRTSVADLSTVDKVIYATNAGYASIKDSSFNGDLNAFKTAMSGETLYYELAQPIETDISEYLTDDNLIQVVSGRTLTFPNQNGDDYRLPVPSEETYMIDLQEAINNG